MNNLCFCENKKFCKPKQPFNILEHDQKCQEQGAVQRENTRVVELKLALLNWISIVVEVQDECQLHFD